MNEEEQTAFDTLTKQLKVLEKQNVNLVTTANSSKAVVDSFDGLDITEARAAIQFKEEAERKNLESQRDYAKALKLNTDKHDAEVKALNTKNAGLNSQLSKTLASSAISTAVNEVGGQPRILNALIQSERLVRVVDDNGALVTRVFPKGSDTPRFNADTGLPMTVEDLLGELSKDESLAGLFAASGNSGGGATTSHTSTTSTTNNIKDIDFSKGNLTEISAAIKQKPGA